jgi:hypothetical protein
MINSDNYVKVLTEMIKSETSDGEILTNNYILSLEKSLSDIEKITFIRSMVTFIILCDRRVNTNNTPVINDRRKAYTGEDTDDDSNDELNKKEMIQLKTWIIKSIFITVVVVCLLSIVTLIYISSSGVNLPMFNSLKEIYNAIFND